MQACHPKERDVKGREESGRAYPHRIPLVKLKGMSEKRNSELADRLLQSRADGSRYHFRSWPRLTSL